MKTIAGILLIALSLSTVCSCSSEEVESPTIEGFDEYDLASYLEGIEGCDITAFGGDWTDINYMHHAFETLVGLTQNYDPITAPELLKSGQWSEYACYDLFPRDQGFELDKFPSYSAGDVYVGYNHHIFHFFPDGTCEADIITAFDNEEEYFNREVELNSTYTWEYNAESRSLILTQYYKDQTAEREYRILGMAQKILLVEFDTIAWNRNSHKDEPAIERMLFVIKN